MLIISVDAIGIRRVIWEQREDTELKDANQFVEKKKTKELKFEDVLERARTLGFAICWRPNMPDLPQIPRLFATRMDITTFCLVPSMAASQARLSSASSALDFAIPEPAAPDLNQ